MAFDALRGYVQLANGLTDVTRQRALQAAKQLLEQGGDVVDLAVSTAVSGGVARQAQSLAEDLLATSRTNRDLLIGLVRTEVERAVSRLGLVGADELAAMTRVVDRLQSQLDAAIAFGGDLVTSPGRQPRATAAPDVDADAAAGEQARPRKVPAKRVVPAAATETAERAAVPAAPAKKVPAKKVPAKKATAKKATAKKAAKKPTTSAPSSKRTPQA